MTYAIRYTLIILPLGLIISGCAAPQRTQATNHRASGPSARPATLIVDRSEGPTRRTAAGSAATDTQHDITLDQIREHVRNKTALVIDARTPEQFARGHVHGAMNVPAGEVESYLSRVEQAVRHDQFIIIYCNGPACHASDLVYEYLTSQGFINMRVYSAGWLALASAKNMQ